MQDYCSGRKWILPDSGTVGAIFIACVELFLKICQLAKLKEKSFLMRLCYSMSLEAISPPQRGSAEWVTLFCGFIGLLSRVVEEDRF